MNNRHWSILCWNIRGLNATEKHNAVRDKIEESGCSVICLQETKMQHIDMQFLRKFTPRRFDKYDFIPSSGASGGILCIWNSAVFVGTTLDKKKFWSHYFFYLTTQSGHLEPDNSLWTVS